MFDIDDQMVPLMLLYAACFWIVQQPTIQKWWTGLVGASLWSGTQNQSPLTQVGCAFMAVGFAAVAYLAGVFVFKIDTQPTLLLASVLYYIVSNPMVLAWVNTNVFAVLDTNSVITGNGAFLLAIGYLALEWVFLRYNGGKYGVAPKRGLLRGIMA